MATKKPVEGIKKKEDLAYFVCLLEVVNNTSHSSAIHMEELIELIKKAKDSDQVSKTIALMNKTSKHQVFLFKEMDGLLEKMAEVSDTKEEPLSVH
jgi:hypothetical protein